MPPKRSSLNNYQRTVLNAATDKALFIGGRMSGKTTTAEFSATDAAGKGRQVIIITHAQRMLKEIREDVRQIAGRKHAITKNNMHEIKLTSGGRMKFLTFSGIPDKIRGVKDPHIVLDEAQNMKQHNVDELFECLATHQGTLFASVQYRPDNYFISKFYGRDDVVTAVCGTLDAPHVDNEYVYDYIKKKSPEVVRKELMVQIVLRPSGHALVGLFHLNDKLQCLKCDFEVEIPEDAPDQVQPIIRKWAIGKASLSPCDQKI